MTSTPLSTLDPDRLAPDASNPAVADVMRDEVVFCLPSTPADVVAKLLVDNNLREICVLLDRRPVGYVRGDDIVSLFVEGKVVVGGSDFAVRAPTTTAQARDVMAGPVLLVDEAQRIGEVASLMKQQGRLLAIVTHDDETPVGMVTPVELGEFALSVAVPANG